MPARAVQAVPAAQPRVLEVPARRVAPVVRTALVVRSAPVVRPVWVVQVPDLAALAEQRPVLVA